MNKTVWQKKSTWIVSSVVVVLVIVRMILPPILLKNLNEYLGKFSPLYSLHIEDLSLHVWRLAYTFDGIEGKLKAKTKSGDFLQIKKTHVSVAWRELFVGRFVVDVMLDEANLTVTKENLDALSGAGYSKDQAKSDAKNIKQATVPFDLERLHCQDCSFEFSDIAGLPREQNFQLSSVDVVANNLTPRGVDGLSVFSVSGNIQGKAPIKVAGQFKPNKDPVDWSMNLELKHFHLTELNPIARRMVPITFKQGTLTLYSAAQSVDNHVLGYVKPFMKDMVLIGDKGDFKNFEQFLLEIAGTIGNYFLKNSKTHELATKITFKSVNGKVVTDTSKALQVAIDNAAGTPVSEKLDETLDLK